MTNKTKGFIYGAIAAASYGMNPLFALPLYAAGMSVDTVLFYRYFFATIVLGILMKMQHQSFALHKADVLPLVIMGLLFSFSSLLLFMSYNYMDAGIASTILFVYPVMVAVIMGIFFKEKISAITVFSILLALSGIALLYQGDGNKPLSTLGIIFVLLSSLSYAIYIVGPTIGGLKVFEVSDKNGKPIALFYSDYFRRPTKRGGCWSIRNPSRHDTGRHKDPCCPDNRLYPHNRCIA